MWLFCIDQYGQRYSVGFVQGSAGIWCEILTVESIKDAIDIVHFLNGGTGHAPDIKYLKGRP